MIEYDNQFFCSEKEICERYDLNYYFFKLYMKDLKMSIIETTEYMRSKQKRLVKKKVRKQPEKIKFIYDGESFKSLLEACRKYKINYMKTRTLKTKYGLSYQEAIDFMINHE